MGFSNDIISLPYTIDDACDAFDYQTNDLQVLFLHGDINRWARYKPVEYYISEPYGFALTEYQRRSVNYGIGNIPYWSSKLLGQMLNFWFGIDTSPSNAPEIGIVPEYWSYTRPQTAFRLSDLIDDPTDSSSKGYFKRAKEPLGNLKSSTVEVSPGGYMTFIFEKNEEGVSAGLTVKYEDLQMGGYSVYNMYFGFSLWNRQTSASLKKLYTITQNDTMVSFQQMGASVHAYTEDPQIEGDYDIFPFASADIIRGAQSPRQSDIYKMASATNIRSNYIALVEPQRVHIQIRWADVKVLFLSSYRDESKPRIIRNSFTLDNAMSDYNVTITKMTIEYLKEDYTVDHTQDLINSINLAAGSSYAGTADHDFGSAGSSHIKSTRMTIVTLSGVVFFSSGSSAKTAQVTDGPTPES